MQEWIGIEGTVCNFGCRTKFQLSWRMWRENKNLSPVKISFFRKYTHKVFKLLSNKYNYFLDYKKTLMKQAGMLSPTDTPPTPGNIISNSKMNPAHKINVNSSFFALYINYWLLKSAGESWIELYMVLKHRVMALLLNFFPP